MKKTIVALLVAITALSLTISSAEARRLGGGGSFGRQSQSLSRPTPAPAQPSQSLSPAPPHPAAPPIPQKPSSPWKGILGGALVGLGIGALMSHFGFGGAMGGMLGTLLMIGLVVLAGVFIMRLFRRNHDSGAPAFAGDYPPAYTPEIGSRIEPNAGPALQSVPAAPGGNTQWGVPADFDVPGFLRQAKTYFIRLQAAWDKADINDIREFTTPEMFAELRVEIHERGASSNHTDAVSLDADLLGIETLGSDYLASVKFSGMIKEDEHAPAAPFAEVWNLSKPVSGQGRWVLAGIQQLS